MPFIGDLRSWLGSEPSGVPEMADGAGTGYREAPAIAWFGLVKLLARQAAQEHWRSVQQMGELCASQAGSRASAPGEIRGPQSMSSKPDHDIRFLSVRNVAEICRVSRRLAGDRGELVAHRFGRQRRIAPEDFEVFVKLRRHVDRYDHQCPIRQ